MLEWTTQNKNRYTVEIASVWLAQELQESIEALTQHRYPIGQDTRKNYILYYIL